MSAPSTHRFKPSLPIPRVSWEQAERLGRMVLISVVVGLVVVHFFDGDTHVDSTTIGLLAVALVLLALDRIEEFKLPGGIGAKLLRKKVEKLGELEIRHLPSEGFESKSDVGGSPLELAESTGDPLAGVAVLRGQIRDRLAYINTSLLGENCCDDPFGVLDRLRGEERLPPRRIEALVEVLMATEQIMAHGGVKDKAILGLVKSASGIHRGIAPIVFEKLVEEALHDLGVPLLGSPIPGTGGGQTGAEKRAANATIRTEFLIRRGRRSYLVQARLAELPNSPLLHRVMNELEMRLRSEKLPAGQVLIAVPNDSRSLEDEVPSWLQVLRLDDLRSGRWQ
ncbi:MAG TPA: hypothetical protein VNY83_01405 [Solirubrobacterales bacterium]|jgi:hypothetical protein|nr:hypothetical protein [Solirubrobacterales bacterium]